MERERVQIQLLSLDKSEDQWRRKVQKERASLEEVTKMKCRSVDLFVLCCDYDRCNSDWK